MPEPENIEILRLQADLRGLKKQADQLGLDIVATLMRLALLELRTHGPTRDASEHTLN